MNLPNKLTISRIILVVIMVILFYIPIPGDVYGLPVKLIILDIIFIVASYTDHLDGRIARRDNLVTTFGKFLDPIADKILVISAMVLLVELNKIPAWIPIIIIFREFVVSGYRLIAAGKKGNVIAANIWGKTKTVTQIIAIVITFIDRNSFGAFLTGNLTNIYDCVINILSFIMLIACVVATIFSGWTYIKNGEDLLKD